MSLAYADALTYKEELGGQLGAPEYVEPRESWTRKADELADAILASTSKASTSGSSGVVVFTGAGISVSSGIPDFRGPDGVWTRQKQGRPPPSLRRGVSFATARPSLSHLAVAELVSRGFVSRVVTQNVDGIHSRSGVPRDRLSELHGCVFVETCSRCGAVHERDFETGTVGLKNTGRRCRSCSKDGTVVGGRLRDTVLDWDSPLPEKELALSERDASTAAASLCLGTSLQIRPANTIPERTLRRERPPPGQLFVVNLQETPKDRLATRVVRARCDDVMARVLARVLGREERVPTWRREDKARVSLELATPASKKKRANPATLVVRVESVHGAEGEAGFPLPTVSGVGVALVPFGPTTSDGGEEEAKDRARESAARRALRAAAISDEDEGEDDGEGDDGGVVYLDEGGGGRPRFAAVLPEKTSTSTKAASGSAATGNPPFSARVELPGDASVAVAVSLGLGLAADPDRRTLDATREGATAAFVFRRSDAGNYDEKSWTTVPAVVLHFVTQEVDCNGPIDAERREIEAEEGDRKASGDERTKKRAKV